MNLTILFISDLYALTTINTGSDEDQFIELLKNNVKIFFDYSQDLIKTILSNDKNETIKQSVNGLHEFIGVENNKDDTNILDAVDDEKFVFESNNQMNTYIYNVIQWIKNLNVCIHSNPLYSQYLENSTEISESFTKMMISVNEIEKKHNILNIMFS